MDPEEDGRPCVYCLGKGVRYSVCIDCRTRLERAESGLAKLRNLLTVERRAFWKLDREFRRLKNAKPEGRAVLARRKAPR